MSELGDITARMVIETRHPLPAGARKAVRVDFYPEDVKYKDGTAPLYGWSLDAAQLSDGSCQLPKRLIGIRGHLRNGRDMVVCIIVNRSEEHTSELQSLMRSSYAVFCMENTKTIT